MEHRVALTGTGRAVLAAYGMADAEHQVEKELRRALPGSRVQVTEVARAAGEGARIVEEFEVGYRLSVELAVRADTAEAARRAALREAREALAGTRHARLRWDAPAR